MNFFLYNLCFEVKISMSIYLFSRDQEYFQILFCYFYLSIFHLAPPFLFILFFIVPEYHGEDACPVNL